MADISHFILWYLAISIIGIVAFPIAFRFFSRLPERGATLARPLGLLIWGFAFWMLVSLGVLQNDLGGEVVAFLLMAGFSILALRGDGKEKILQWIKSNWKSLVRCELVFLFLFAAWAVVRAANPEVQYTEKPMEQAFINAILRSPSFPPQDPWLSGYAISYYYFGYVMIAMLTRITGVVTGVAFNLSSALWFGMIAAAAYGVVYDLLTFWQNRKEKKGSSSSANSFSNWGALLGPFFILIAGNFEGVLEILYARGAFWKADGTSKFWSWLSIADLNQAPTQPVSWWPNRTASWLWWRGSRVIQDTNLLGGKIEIIDEFPFFSFLLSDLHPHVLAMPFALMAIGLCLNLFISAGEESISSVPFEKWFKRWQFWLTALILGSMAFLNTWNFPIYVGLFCLTLSYLRTRELGWSGKRVIEFLGMGVTLAIVGIILFLPFYIGFKSQAGGFLPSLEFITPGINFWVMFGPLLIPILCGLMVLIIKSGVHKEWKKGIYFGIVIFIGLFTISMLIGAALFNFGEWGNQMLGSSLPAVTKLGARMIEASQAFNGYLHAGTEPSTVLMQALSRRLAAPGTWLTLLLIVVGAWALLAGSVRSENREANCTQSKGYEFVILLALLGAGLTLFPEFFYLRDQFGTRMNTIFKFYFEAWMLWGITAAFASAVLLKELRGIGGVLYRVLWVAAVAGALTYPVIMIMNKTNNFKPAQWTLDGNAYIEKYRPDEVAAVDWLRSQPLGTVSEAVGGSYSDYARISMLTGDPTVLGWPGHESQWRGGSVEMGTRQSDIEALYTTSSWDEAFSIVRRYHIRYVYIGDMERSAYPVNSEKFDSALHPAYQNGSVTIYEIPDSLLELGK